MSDHWLVINRHPMKLRRYADWLGNDVAVTLVAPKSVVDAAGIDEVVKYGDIIVLGDFENNSRLIAECLRVAEARPVDKVIGIAEFDLLRAAHVREVLRLPGQGVASALAFRDKVVMKEHLCSHGVPVADWRAVTSFRDLVDGYRALGPKVVLKPRRGGGSQGVEVIRAEADLVAAARSRPELAGDSPADLMVEPWVEHRLLHVDGIVVDGTARMIWPSVHGGAGCLSHIDGEPLISAMLDRDDPRWERVVGLVVSALDALPAPATHMFHAEVFETADGFLLNEIGCRLGGSQVGPTLLAAFSVDLVETYVRSVAGQRPDLPELPASLGGWMTIPPVPGTVVRVPDGDCEIEGVISYTLGVEVGDVLSAAGTSIDAVASFVVRGDTRDDVEHVLGECRKWFENGFLVSTSEVVE